MKPLPYLPSVSGARARACACACACLALVVLISPAYAQDNEAAGEIWDPPVVTPAGQSTRVSEAPSTTFVMTGDEIRRSGATSLPEILRRVPGLDVRLLGATDGQVGPRGFAYESADRVLVMIDGRTVFLDFSGATAYEMLPVSLIDIERVEVVLGPGAAVYGNKAMLGVVNIITKTAADSPWTEARVDAGPPGDFRAAARHGLVAGPWRVRATALARRLTLYPQPGVTGDRPEALAGGGTLSLGYNPAANREITLEIGAMQGRDYVIPTGSRIQPFDSTLAYARVLARLGLGGPGSPAGDLYVNAVWNGGWIRSSTFPSAAVPFDARFHTPYLEVAHELHYRALGVPMQGRWGSELRLNRFDSTITADEKLLVNVAAFAGNTVILGRWRLGAGLRVDRQTLTRTNVSPRASVVFTPIDGHQLRLAFNTGYNNPNSIQNFGRFDAAPGGPIVGNQSLASEKIVYGELGYSGSFTTWLRLFANGFAYRMTDWISLDPQAATAMGVPYGNNDRVDAWGGETGFDVVIRHASGYAHYALLHMNVDGKNPYNVDNTGSPRHKVGAGLRLDLPYRIYFTLDGQYFGRAEVARVSPMPVLPNIYQVQRLSHFIASSARLGWTTENGLDLSLAATNLLDDRTVQFPGAESPAIRVMGTVAYTH